MQDTTRVFDLSLVKVEALGDFIFSEGLPAYFEPNISRSLDTLCPGGLTQALWEMINPRSEMSDDEAFRLMQRSSQQTRHKLSRNQNVELDLESFSASSLYEEYLSELVSLNNFLHHSFTILLKSSPISISERGEIEIDFNLIEEMHGVFPPVPEEQFEQDFQEQEWENFSEYKESMESYEYAYNILVDEEIERWSEYFSLFAPGTAAVLLHVYLEKFLIGIGRLLVSLSIASDLPKKQRRISSIDSYYTFLRDNGLAIDRPPHIAEMMFKTRIVRNKFAHGDWDGVESDLKEIRLSEMVGTCSVVLSTVMNALAVKIATLRNETMGSSE